MDKKLILGIGVAVVIVLWYNHTQKQKKQSGTTGNDEKKELEKLVAKDLDDAINLIPVTINNEGRGNTLKKFAKVIKNGDLTLEEVKTVKAEFDAENGKTVLGEEQRAKLMQDLKGILVKYKLDSN